MLLNLSVNNNTLVAYHSTLTENKPSARMTVNKAAGVTALTVDNVYGFLVGQYVLLGNWGDPTAEIVRVHTSSAPSVSTITLNAATVFDHYTDTPIVVLDYNQIEFSRATTADGSKSVLATYNITPDQMMTVYTDVTNTTGFAFFRFKNEAATTYSGYCTATDYAGNGETAYEKIVMEACSLASVAYGSQYATEQQLIRDANDALDRIQEKQDWAFELVKNDTSIATTTNENEYALSGLTYALKYKGTQQGILDVFLGTGKLKVLQPDEMDKLYEGTAKTTTAATINISDTSVTLTDSYDFGESGTIYVSATSAAPYTANAQSTGILSGFSASQFDAIIASGTNVFQNIAPSLPTRYSIFNGSIFLDVPVSSTYAGRKLKFKYLKRLSQFSSFATTTEIPFYNILSIYIASKIVARKKMFDDEQKFLGQFMAYMESNANTYKLPTLEEYEYYVFSNKPATQFED